MVKIMSPDELVRKMRSKQENTTRPVRKQTGEYSDYPSGKAPVSGDFFKAKQEEGACILRAESKSVLASRWEFGRVINEVSEHTEYGEHTIQTFLAGVNEALGTSVAYSTAMSARKLYLRFPDKDRMLAYVDRGANTKNIQPLLSDKLDETVRDRLIAQLDVGEISPADIPDRVKAIQDKAKPKAPTTEVDLEDEPEADLETPVLDANDRKRDIGPLDHSEEKVPDHLRSVDPNFKSFSQMVARLHAITKNATDRLKESENLRDRFDSLDTYGREEIGPMLSKLYEEVKALHMVVGVMDNQVSDCLAG